MSIQDISEFLECTTRTAERVKATLADVFPSSLIEVPHPSEKKKYWRLKNGAINFLLSFSTQELSLLERIKNLLNENEQNHLNNIINKLKALTNKENLISLENDISTLVDSFYYCVKQSPHEIINYENIEKINCAIIAQKKINIKGKYNEIICPYGIISNEYRYLVAYNEKYNKILLYGLSKIEQFEILNEYFEKDEDFDLKTYAQNSFGVWQGEKLNVKLLFSKKVRDDVLNYYFHSSQIVTSLKNKDVLVEFCASGEKEICWNLFKWEDNVKILAPENLKTTYKNTLQKIMNNIN
jgi:predicted DNA-binding transcriptional regulator YafY